MGVVLGTGNSKQHPGTAHVIGKSCLPLGKGQHLADYVHATVVPSVRLRLPIHLTGESRIRNLAQPPERVAGRAFETQVSIGIHERRCHLIVSAFLNLSILVWKRNLVRIGMGNVGVLHVDNHQHPVYIVLVDGEQDPLSLAGCWSVLKPFSRKSGKNVGNAMARYQVNVEHRYVGKSLVR